MSEFIIETTITGAQPTVSEFRSQFLDSFPVIKKDSPEEIIGTLSGGDLDPRPTLLNLSGEFPALTFSVVEYAADAEDEQAFHRSRTGRKFGIHPIANLSIVTDR